MVILMDSTTPLRHFTASDSEGHRSLQDSESPVTDNPALRKWDRAMQRRNRALAGVLALSPACAATVFTRHRAPSPPWVSRAIARPLHHSSAIVCSFRPCSLALLRALSAMVFETTLGWGWCLVTERILIAKSEFTLAKFYWRYGHATAGGRNIESKACWIQSGPILPEKSSWELRLLRALHALRDSLGEPSRNLLKYAFICALCLRSIFHSITNGLWADSTKGRFFHLPSPLEAVACWSIDFGDFSVDLLLLCTRTWTKLLLCQWTSKAHNSSSYN